MRLPAMAETLLMMAENNDIQTKDTIDVLDELTEAEFISRKNNTIAKLKKKAKLSQANASINDIDYHPNRKINKSVITQLASNDYIRSKRNVIVMGACGTGKSFIINALGNHACDSQYSVRYVRMYELMSELVEERMMEGSCMRSIKKYSQPDLLIIDDFLLGPINEKEAIDLFALIDFRYSKSSTIIGSQLEISEWHKRIGGALTADSVLDRLTSNAYRLVLYGDSMRKKSE